MKDGWQIVLVTTLPQEIYLARALLESEGIATLLQDELTAQVHNFYSNAIGGVKLFVPQADARRAGELLADGGYSVEHYEPDTPVEAVHTADLQHCPECGSGNIRKERQGDWLMLAFYVMLGVLFPVFRPVYRCFDCGKRWLFRRKKQPPRESGTE